MGDKYVLGAELGVGKTSKVVKALRTTDSKTFAIKLHSKPDANDLKYLGKELFIF